MMVATTIVIDSKTNHAFLVCIRDVAVQTNTKTKIISKNVLSNTRLRSVPALGAIFFSLSVEVRHVNITGYL